jgi:outer membrane protein OmpA-like peptidoglycan-associated protein
MILYTSREVPEDCYGKVLCGMDWRRAFWAKRNRTIKSRSSTSKVTYLIIFVVFLYIDSLLSAELSLAAPLDARGVCGTYNEEVSEKTKEAIGTKAREVTSVGTDDLQAAAETAKRDIEIGKNRSDAERELHYLNYISCIIIYQDAHFTTDQKLERINALRNAFLPHPQVPQLQISDAKPPDQGSYEDSPLFFVFFGLGEANITREGDQIIDLAVGTYYEFNKKFSNFGVWVTGYTDSSGEPETWALSERRALAVEDDLVRLGVPVDKLKVAARGWYDPRVPVSGPEPQNRRVEILFQHQ